MSTAVANSETPGDIINEIQRILPDPSTVDNIAPYLPAMFSLRGQPMTLKHHLPLYPLYDINIPKKTLLMCARQVGKSESLNVSNIGMHAIVPRFQSLYVAPLYEMTRRFSANYVKPRINESPIKSLLQDSTCEHSVLQKTFVNKSIMHFSFAFLDCNRIRGLSVDRCNYDEVQMIDTEFIPIIAETMSASPWSRSYYTGTPLTLDNTIHGLWEESSRGEWFIPCKSCGQWNIPTKEFDAFKMIGRRDNVERYGTGLICAHCGRPIWTKEGRWVHRSIDANVLANFKGYHIPQLILPLHCESVSKWNDLHDKLHDVSDAELMNEVFGESCDQGTKLISLTHLQDASTLPWTNSTAFTVDLRFRYDNIICGVDWSGQGIDGESTTFITILGIRPTKLMEVLYMRRIRFGKDRPEEILQIIDLYQKFKCNWLTHDFNGAGREVDTMIRQMLAIPPERIMPISYTGTGARELIRLVPGVGENTRSYYSYDKTWSISLLIDLIKSKRLVFPAWDDESRDLLSDFLNLMTERRERNTSADLFLIKKVQGKKRHDDGVHSINFTLGVAYRLIGIPDVAEKFRSTISKARMQLYHPEETTVDEFERPYTGPMSDWD